MHRRPSPLVRAIAVAMVLAPPLHAQLVGGGGAPSGNFFPFGNPVGAAAGTIYQQVYAASSWTGVTPITGVRFFQQGGTNIRAATYSIFLSTTARTVDAVNPLSTADFDSNRGADNVLFATLVLGGAATPTITFTGAAFQFDPSRGNLLLDMRISGAGAPAVNPASFQLRNAVPLFSRAHNFSVNVPYNATFGLVTEFLNGPQAVVPEPATYVLTATGLAALALLRRRRQRG